MNAVNWWTNNGKKWTRRLAAPLLALTVAGSVVTYECIKPNAASAAAVAPAPAGPLDADSVSALTALDKAMETLAARVTPAVVNVTVTSRTKSENVAHQMPEGMQQFFGQDGPFDGQNSPFGQFFGPHMQPRGPQIEHGMGSGVVISPDGYIVTNNHVIEGAVDIRVTTSDRRVLKAKLVGADPLTDLAVLKVNESNLTSVPWGDSTQVRPGQTVLAFGNPYGFRFTVTRGIVSAVNRANPDSNRSKPGEFIQTDAAINPGNSGGPLVDARGQVVGINTFLVSPSGTFSGMGFAIPTQIVKPTVETLIRDGKVEHARIGIGISDVTPENAKFFGDSTAMGAVVTQVDPDSPGAKAGLQIGDVITQIDGRKVNDSGELQVYVAQQKPGKKVEVTILRDGKTMTMPITLEELKAAGEHSANSAESQGRMRWGLGLGDLTPELRDQLQAPSHLRGVVIEQVRPGSSADNAGLQQGDVILEVNRHKVQSPADVQQELSKVPQGQDALLLVWSNGGNSFRVLHYPEGA
ncbi:MAG TPA: Do family serine endopeptidase [Candidatus Sulfotelmatobacter sp.]|nr:Do family serine endopeptidase [Candidatus Sulfotelmatobacter sp.]